MSEIEKKAKDAAAELKNADVEEVDDKALEEASGGLADANGFMCNC